MWGLAPFLLALLPFRPRSGVGSASAAYRVLSFTCAMPGGVFLAGLACWLLSWKFIFLFSSSLFLGRVPRLLRLFSPGGRVVVSEAGLAVRVSLLAASLPLPMVFPWRWGHGVRLYLLGWFAILEVLVLKSRVSPFLMVSSLLAWCLEFWVPVPVAPLPRGGPLVLQFVMWSSRAPPDVWPRASVSLLAFDLLVAWSLRLWGDPCLGVQWLSFRGAGVVSFASSC